MRTRREQIEDEASALFAARGYAATSMRDIAKALDLQGGSLYAHILSKEALLAAIVQQASERFHGAVRPLAEGPGMAAARLRAMIRAHVGVVTEAPSKAKVFLFEWTFLGSARREQVALARDAYQAHFERVIAEGMAAGELAPGDPRLAATYVLSALNAIAHWYHPDGPLTPAEIADRYADLFLQGVEHPAPVAVTSP